MGLTAWQKNDVVEIFGITIILTSHPYHKRDKQFMDFTVGDQKGAIPFLTLIDSGKLQGSFDSKAKEDIQPESSTCTCTDLNRKSYEDSGIRRCDLCDKPLEMQF